MDTQSTILQIELQVETQSALSAAFCLINMADVATLGENMRTVRLNQRSNLQLLKLNDLCFFKTFTMFGMAGEQDHQMGFGERVNGQGSQSPARRIHTHDRV